MDSGEMGTTPETQDTPSASVDAPEALKLPQPNHAPSAPQSPEAPADSEAPALSTRRIVREVRFADRPTPRQRRRADLLDVVLSILGIAATWAIGVFANATTQGVTEDVLHFRFIREILLLPITLIEGGVVLVAPIAVVIALARRRRLIAILQALVTGLVAALLGWAALYATSLLPPEMTAPLRVAKAVALQSDSTSTAIGINLVVVVLCALFTVAGEMQNMKTVRWSWIGLWVIVFLGVMRSSMTLPSAFLSVFLGRAVGSAARWIFGFEDRRASAKDIVRALLDIGVKPLSVIRSDLDTSLEPLESATLGEDERGRLHLLDRELEAGEYTVTRRPDSDGNRHYQALTEDGSTVEAVVLDPGREILGTIVDVWNNLRLRGISRWISLSLKATAERATLASLCARKAGVRTPEVVGIALAGDSFICVSKALPPTVPLAQLPSETIPDSVLDDAWRQLQAAHSHGITHRDLDENSIVLDESGALWIVDWERGEVATTELNRRIDIAQMLVVLSQAATPERALASARRILDERSLTTAAPLLQTAVMPSSIRSTLRRGDFLENLRGLVLGTEEAEGVELTNVQRFAPRTVIMVTVLFTALVVVLGSLNFEDIAVAVTQADPMWMAISFGLACLTWVGGAIPLMALSPVKLRFRDAVSAQVAASIATIVAPAGVGPAVVNLRLLKKKRVNTVVAATTVTLQQLLQLFIMLGFLLLVMVLSGNSLSVQLPYATILAVVVLVIVVIGIALSVPKFRQWIWAKIKRTWTQVFPRLIWIVGQPKRLAAILGGNVIMNIGFIGAFWAALTAMGGSMDFLPLALTYLASNSLGSVIPSPGGIGPVEAALTAGLQVAGVSLSIGLPTAVLYRLVTFYGRIPFGWVAMKWMEHKDLL
ncbi:lysylphosphatidylglycerol synthase transmembrane domain-containing protein [Schaalia cardiffensis]|uniref:lysylphosphatidylglycerol synthase transmembrane domain-containing protein n=1 Tax=Schaalia cardiffensis TaxID=181487 RepID=UPI001E3A1F97|nr:lysylphosphatidylglycerol synthase transmembrane domain-containing protein [Schaalia cardiffensis]